MATTNSFSSVLEPLFSLDSRHWRGSEHLQRILDYASQNRAAFLHGLLHTPERAECVLELLSIVLADVPGRWPALDTIVCRARAARNIAESERNNKTSRVPHLLDETGRQVKALYGTLSRLLRLDDTAAIHSTQPGRYITHRALHDFVSRFRLPVGERSVVAIAVPNGPLLAALCFGVTACYVAAPINPNTGVEQFQNDVLQARARCIITTAAEAARLGLDGAWPSQQGIDIITAELGEGMSVDLRALNGETLENSSRSPPACHNGPDDIALVLFTSGTSGTKKVVPLTIHSIISGCAFVVDSWGLTQSDVCLNVMPLYHV